MNSVLANMIVTWVMLVASFCLAWWLDRINNAIKRRYRE